MRAGRRPVIAVLASGGLDSCALIARLARQGVVVAPMYIAGGLRWETAERYWLRRFLGRLRAAQDSRRAVVRLTEAAPSLLPRTCRGAVAPRPLVELSLPAADLYGRHWSLGRGRVPSAASPDAAVYLPGRNLLLTVKAALYCAQQGIGRLAIGVLRGNPFTDSSARFFRQVSAAVHTATGRRVVIERPLARRTKADLIRAAKDVPLHLSVSCISPRGRRHCGRCNKCAERRRAFRAAGVSDLTVYAAR